MTSAPELKEQLQCHSHLLQPQYSYDLRTCSTYSVTDWAISERSWLQTFLQKKPKFLMTLAAVLKNVKIEINWGNFGKMRLLIIPSSGHTEYIPT